jgi:hypothetical protein
VAYDSKEHAMAGVAGISGEMADSPVRAALDHSTVEWRVAEVVHDLRRAGQAAPPLA